MKNLYTLRYRRYGRKGHENMYRVIILKKCNGTYKPGWTQACFYCDCIVEGENWIYFCSDGEKTIKEKRDRVLSIEKTDEE